MKRTASIILVLAVLLTTFVFPAAVSAEDVNYVNVAQLGGVTTGGWDSSDGTGAYSLTHLPTSRLIDGVVEADMAHNCSAGFYYNVRTGYMYIDLGRAYKINHIEVVAYNEQRPLNCAMYDLVVSNEVPDRNAYDPENPNGEYLVATPDYNVNATNLANGVRVFEMPEDSEAYRYVSLEQFTDKGDRFGLTIQEVRVFVDEANIPKSVVVSEGKATGGTGIGGAWTGLVGETSNLVDGKADTEAGFYANFGTKGYMYVDLGAEYKIDRIEILAYNGTYPDRAGDFDLVVTNKVPDSTSAHDNPHKTLVTHVGVDGNATSEAVGYKSFTLPVEAVGNSYRYVSLEKLQANSYGLVVQEIKVYVLEEDLPLSITNLEVIGDSETIALTGELTNGGNEEMTFIMKAYDENGMTYGVKTETIGLSTYVVAELFEAEFDISDLTDGKDCKVDLMAVDSLDEMNPVLYVEDATNDERAILALESDDTELDFTAQQKGMNIEICGTAPGNKVFATMLYPDGEIAYFGYAETSEDGEFGFEIVMPEKALTGEYTAILGVLGNKYDADARTASFDFASIVDEFENVTAASFMELAEKYSISYPELYALLAEKAETVGESFMLAKAVLESGKANENVTALNNSVNIKTAMRAALLIDATINKADFEAEIDEYKDTMPLIFTEDFANADKFVKYFNKVKNTADLDDAEGIIKAYEKSIALAILSGGTRADIATVIANYADAMNIDLEEIEDAGVTINEVAKKITISDTSMERFLKNGMGADVESAIDGILADKKKNNSSSGGGGGGGRGSSTIYPPPSVPLETTQPSGDKTEQSVEATSETFTDLSGFDWAKASIELLSEKEILGGIGDGKFAPSANLTREQAAKIIVLAFGLESTMKTNKFEDCDINEWYYPYVTAASANGIVKGTTRTEFGIGSYITRQDMAVMLDRALLAKGIKSGASSDGFTDMDKVSEYAKESVSTLAAMGIITGMEDGSFCPANQITRAEAAVMIGRILELF